MLLVAVLGVDPRDAAVEGDRVGVARPGLAPGAVGALQVPADELGGVVALRDLGHAGGGEMPRGLGLPVGAREVGSLDAHGKVKLTRGVVELPRLVLDVLADDRVDGEVGRVEVGAARGGALVHDLGLAVVPHVDC